MGSDACMAELMMIYSCSAGLSPPASCDRQIYRTPLAKMCGGSASAQRPWQHHQVLKSKSFAQLCETFSEGLRQTEGKDFVPGAGEMQKCPGQRTSAGSSIDTESVNPVLFAPLLFGRFKDAHLRSEAAAKSAAVIRQASHVLRKQ